MGIPESNAKFLIKICIKFTKMKANIGEKSSPPIGGSTALKGLKIGFESWWIKETPGWLLNGEIQLRIIPINIAQKIIFNISRTIE